MLRVILEYLVPLLLPTLLYLAWVAWRRYAVATGRAAQAPEWTEGPWFWLAVGGIGLTLAAFVATALLWGHEPGEGYLPAKLLNGQILPGRFGTKP